MPALETALSLTISAGEHLVILFRNVDARFKLYSRLYLRKGRLRRHCVRQSALSNNTNELLSGRKDVVTCILENDMDRKVRAKMQR